MRRQKGVRRINKWTTKEFILFVAVGVLLLFLILNAALPLNFSGGKTRITGFSISKPDVSQLIFKPNTNLKGDVEVTLNKGDLLPPDTIVKVFTSAPVFPSKYYCSDGTTLDYCELDYSTGLYDCEYDDVYELLDACGDTEIYYGSCSDVNGKCCGILKGSGDFYPQHICSDPTKDCREFCDSSFDSIELTLEEFVALSSSSDKGNIISGEYNDVDYINPDTGEKENPFIGSGYGFAPCETPEPELCETNDDCSSPTPYCVDGVCVECITDSDCSGGYVCSNNECIEEGELICDPPCNTEPPYLEECVNGQCCIGEIGWCDGKEDQCCAGMECKIMESIEGGIKTCQYPIEPTDKYCNNGEEECMDTDGDDPTKAGTLTIKNLRTGETKTYYDHCDGEDKAIEYYCSGTSAESCGFQTKTYFCEEGEECYEDDPCCGGCEVELTCDYYSLYGPKVIYSKYGVPSCGCTWPYECNGQSVRGDFCSGEKCGCRNTDDCPEGLVCVGIGLGGAGWGITHHYCSEEKCIPDCEGKECGDDGCGGSCGDCAKGYVCVNGKCVMKYWPIAPSSWWTSSAIKSFFNNIITGNFLTGKAISGHAVSSEDFSCEGWDPINKYVVSIEDLGLKTSTEEGWNWVNTILKTPEGGEFYYNFDTFFIASEGDYHRECYGDRCGYFIGVGADECDRNSECEGWCEPNWDCVSWSEVECINGLQTRTCIDLNDCGFTPPISLIQQPCTEVCQENWDCEYSECDKDTLTQVRISEEDLNNCGTYLDLENQCPATKSCTMPGPGPGGGIPNWVPWLVLGVLILAIATVVSLLLISKKAKRKQEIPSELVDYIRKASARGMSKADIKKSLLNSGWNEKIIDSAFVVAFRGAAQQQQSTFQKKQFGRY